MNSNGTNKSYQACSIILLKIDFESIINLGGENTTWTSSPLPLLPPLLLVVESAPPPPTRRRLRPVALLPFHTLDPTNTQYTQAETLASNLDSRGSRWSPNSRPPGSLAGNAVITGPRFTVRQAPLLSLALSAAGVSVRIPTWVWLPCEPMMVGRPPAGTAPHRRLPPLSFCLSDVCGYRGCRAGVPPGRA